MGFLGKSKPSSVWYVDSGASHHMTHSYSPLETFSWFSFPAYVLFFPKLAVNMILISRLITITVVSFSHDGCVVRDQEIVKQIVRGYRVDNLLVLAGILSNVIFFFLPVLLILSSSFFIYGIAN